MATMLRQAGLDRVNMSADSLRPERIATIARRWWSGAHRCRTSLPPLLTPDGRYLIVRHRLWRSANPGLSAEARSRLVDALMTARREVGIALRSKDEARLARARAAVHAAKIALGERGPAWCTYGARDFNRFLVKNTPYAAWYRSQPASGNPAHSGFK